jgi:hypothetical protein
MLGLPAHLKDLTDRATHLCQSGSLPPIHAAPTPQIGSILPPGAAVRTCLPSPPDPEVVGLYITACASGAAERGVKPNSVSTIERRLAAIGWNCSQRGMTLDRKDRAIATVMAGIRNTHAAPPSAERSAAAGRPDYDAGDAGSGNPARSSRSSDAVDRLCRRSCDDLKSPVSILDATKPRTGAAGSKSTTKGCADHAAWQDWLARG